MQNGQRNKARLPSVLLYQSQLLELLSELCGGFLRTCGSLGLIRPFPWAFPTDRGISESTTAHDGLTPPRPAPSPRGPQPPPTTPPPRRINFSLLSIGGGDVNNNSRSRTSAPAPRRSGRACASRTAATPSGSPRSRGAGACPTCVYRRPRRPTRGRRPPAAARSRTPSLQ